MKKSLIKKSVLIFVTTAALFGNAQACTFHWETYGNTDIHELLSSKIAGHVTDEYCAKFNRDNELVIQFQSYVLPNMVVGTASVGIRKKHSTYLPVNTFSGVSVDTDSSNLTTGHAYDVAVRASLNAIDDLMSALRTYQIKY